MKTKAAVLTKLKHPLHFVDLTLPELKPGQVLVEVAYSGLCHSQILEIVGKRGEDKYLPHTLGHEGSGIVLQVGPGVTKVIKGEKVVLSWIRGTGADVSNTVYQSPIGPINSGAISTFMQYAIISENRVVPIPDTMPLREAALLGCAIPTGAGMIMNSTCLQSENTIVIFGVGGIGLSAVLAANMKNAGTIIAVDINDEKLELAEKMGATHLINSSLQEPLVAILEITNGLGVDYAVEAVGKRSTMETAFQSVRDNGGLCILAGNLPKGEMIRIDPFDLIRGKRITGTWGGETSPDRDIPIFVELFQSGELNLKELITHIYPFEDINKGINDLKEGKVGRALVDMGIIKGNELT